MEFSENLTAELWVAELSISTIEDKDQDNGTFTATLISDEAAGADSYIVNSTANVATVYASNQQITNLYFVEAKTTISEDEQNAILTIATTLDQAQLLTVSFIPTNTTGDFLDETDGLSGETRQVELSFELATNSGTNEDEGSNLNSIKNPLVNLGDNPITSGTEETPLYVAEFEIPIRTADGVYDDDGLITIELVESLGYSLDQELSSKAQILIEDSDIPELSLTSSIEAVAGGVIYLPVTSNVEIRKLLEVKYIARNEVGDFLIESEGKFGSEGKISLAFTQSETSTSAFASFPFNIGYSEEFNTGRIEIELIVDEDVTRLPYLVEGSASTTTIEISRGAIPEIAILESNLTVDEDSSVVEIPVEASIDPERALWVTYTTENTEGDFLAETDDNSETARVEILRFTLDADLGEFTSILRVNLRSANGIDENNGTISVTLDQPTRESGYTLDETRAETVITVNDIDSVPTLTIVDVRDVETLGVYMFELTLSQISRKEISVDFETSSITALADLDFENTLGTVTIPIEQISASIAVNIIQDQETEIEEYFSLSLSNPVNVELAKDTAVGVIAENEKWQISISTTYNQIIEGEDAQIVISSNIPITDNQLQVFLGVSQVGEVAKWRVKRLVKMTGMEYTYNFETKDNKLVDPGKKIIVKLVPGRDYDISPSASQVVVEVFDNDSAETNDNTDEVVNPRISPSSLIVDALLKNARNLPSFTGNLGPFVTINAIEPIVNEGQPAQFEILAQVTPKEKIEINLDVQGSVGLFDRDQITSVTLDANNSSMIFSVNTLNDNETEDDELLEVSIVQGINYRIGNPASATVTIVDIDDRKYVQQQLISGQQSILPEILGFMSEKTLNEISNRGNLINSGQDNFSFNFSDNTAITDMIKEGGELINKNSTSWQQLLDDTQFQFSLVPGAISQASATIWGIGDYQELKSSFSEVDTIWDGNVFGGVMGIDTEVTENLIAGLAVSSTQSLFDYQLTSERDLKITTNSIGFSPYISWQSQDQDLKFNTFAGFGLGGIALGLPDFRNQRVNNQSYSFGIKASNRVFTTASNLNGISNELQLIGESWYTGQTINALDNIIDAAYINSGRFRMYGKNSVQIETESGSIISPILNVGLRGDSKNNDAIFGLELGGEFKYSNPVGLSMDGVSNFYMSQFNKVNRWDVEGAFKFDHGHDELGLLLELTPYWQIADNPEQGEFWESELLKAGIDNNHSPKATQVSAEFGYGLNFAEGQGILTPFSGFEASELSNSKRFMGMRVAIGDKLRLEVEGTDVEESSGNDKQNLQLNGSYNW